MRKALMRITFRQLQIFQSVCSHRSYSRAAEDMALTQPAVSLQVRQLEEQVGQPLFEFVGRKLYLTQAGTSLLAASDDIFNRLASLDMTLSNLRGSLQGELRLAVASSIQYLTPHLLAAFQQHYPEISFRLEVHRRPELMQRLLRNQDDVALVAMVPEDKALEFFPLLNNSIFAVARPDHPLAATGDALPLSQLEAYPLLQSEIGSGTRSICDAFLQQHRVKPSQVIEIGSAESLIQGAIAGLGIALVNAHSVTPFLQKGALIRLPFADFPIQRSWCAVFARDKRHSPVADAFLSFLREERGAIRHLAARMEMLESESDV